MEIKRLGENKIRCALSEEEIRELGYDIDDIIGNTEVTQRFMRSVVELIEEQENISLEHFSPMVKAELLQDHSMAITFGGDSEMNFKSLVDTVGQLMSQLAPERLEEFRQMDKEQKKNLVDDFLQKYNEKKKEIAENAGKPQEQNESGAQGNAAESSDSATDAEWKKQQEEEENRVYESSVPFGLEFDSIEEVTHLLTAGAFPERIPQNSLYRMKDKFYLLMDFIHFSKADLRPFAFLIVEYNKNRFADTARIAFIKEHGKCIVENEALQTLMQL